MKTVRVTFEWLPAEPGTADVDCPGRAGSGRSSGGASNASQSSPPVNGSFNVRSVLVFASLDIR